VRMEAFCLPQNVNLPKICGSHKSDHKLDICRKVLCWFCEPDKSAFVSGVSRFVLTQPKWTTQTQHIPTPWIAQLFEIYDLKLPTSDKVHAVASKPLISSELLSLRSRRQTLSYMCCINSPLRPNFLVRELPVMGCWTQ
jgi:hypothetical protein